MKILKNPMANAFYLALTTAIYAAVLIISSEFLSSNPLHVSNSAWSKFITQGNLKFVGLCMIGITVVVDLLSALRRKRFDEYQISILEKNLLINGMLAVVLLPIAAFSLIFIPCYSVEFVFACMLLQWLIMIGVEIIYLVKNY